MFSSPPRTGIRPGKKSPAHDLYLPALSLPNDIDNSASMAQVIVNLKNFFRSQAQVASPAPALCSAWAIHTWFADALPLSPPMVITGPRLEAESLLTALQAVCRNGLMICAGANVRDLKTLPIRDLFPTLVLPEPQLGKAMESLISLSSRPGRLLAGSVPDVYRAIRIPSLQDRFCPKLMYLGEDATTSVSIPNVIRLHLAPTGVPKDESPVEANQLQNQLYTLRVRHWPAVQKSTFVADKLSARTREVATVLSRALTNELEAQASVVSLLKHQDEMSREERAGTPEALTVEAILSLSHEDRGITELLASTLAARVNRLLAERQESWTVSPEEIGHLLKRMGMPTVRLGSAGRGLKLDKATSANAHRLANYYDVLAPVAGGECTFCARVGVRQEETS